MTDRERALVLLGRIERERLYASLILGRESGFVRTLVLGVLRWRSRLDEVIAISAARRIEKIDQAVVDVLRIGVYQLMFMDVARYAAVSETVDLAARYAKRARGFVNAVMRQVSREIPEARSRATELAHPEWMLARWEMRFGADRTRAIAVADQELSYPDVIVLGGEPPEGSKPSAFVEGMYRLDGAVSGEDVYALDEGSAVVALMAARSGSEVLDLAAAPGGKTIVMRHHGARVISNDVSMARLRPLAQRGGPIVVSDGRRSAFRRRHQTVLLDAPCSATGTLRKSPEIKWRLTLDDILGFTTLQKELLTSALDMTGETCVYATCSLEAEENEMIVREVLAARGDFSIADAADVVVPGARSWVRDGVLQLTPEAGTDGFTAHVLRRNR